MIQDKIVKKIKDLSDYEAHKICDEHPECKTCPLSLGRYCLMHEISQREVVVERTLSDKEKRNLEIYTKYKNGVSVKELSKDYNLTIGAVRNIISMVS